MALPPRRNENPRTSTSFKGESMTEQEVEFLRGLAAKMKTVEPPVFSNFEIDEVERIASVIEEDILEGFQL